MLVAGSKVGFAAEMIESIFSQCVVAVALSCFESGDVSFSKCQLQNYRKWCYSSGLGSVYVTKQQGSVAAQITPVASDKLAETPVAKF